MEKNAFQERAWEGGEAEGAVEAPWGSGLLMGAS
jgi:hypothetical protein